MVLPALIMFKLTGDKKYLSASLTSCDYYMGGNPLNIVWMTGLGDNRVKQVLHLDTWFSNQEEMIPGIIPYGPTYDGWIANNGPWSSEFALERIYPEQSLWPPHETWFENRYCPVTNEFTVHQSSAPAAAIFGILSSVWKGSWQPNQPPVITITNPSSYDEISEGNNITITVDASDPDGYIRKVEYYNNWHKLGESTRPPFSFTWDNRMPAPYGISAVAFDNKGAFSKAEITTGLKQSSPEEDITELKLYPVPSEKELNIEFSIDFPAITTVEIIDLTGRLLCQKQFNIWGPEHHILSIDLSETGQICDGTYICRLTASSKDTGVSSRFEGKDVYMLI